MAQMTSENITSSESLSTAFERCSDLARQHYENFPVGRFIRKDLRPHVHAIYSFARTADDFADEPAFEGKRLDFLSDWRLQLYQAEKGVVSNPIFNALSHTLQVHQPPIEWLDDLIQAFEYDVKNPRHQTFEDLMRYSTQSANPVGRLVLWLHGFRSEQLFQLSDHICTGLQLTNFWQDIAVDWEKDRVYLPQDLLTEYGYSEADIAAGLVNEPFQKMMLDLYQRTEDLFGLGKPLCSKVGGRLSIELKAVWNGGRRILEKTRENGFDVYRHRPRLSKKDVLPLIWKTLFWF